MANCNIYVKNNFNRLVMNITQINFLYRQNVHVLRLIPAGIYLLEVNNRNTRTRCEICSNLTIKTPERRQHQWRRSGVFIVNFEHISHLVLMFLSLTLNFQLPAGIKVNYKRSL